MPDRQKVPKSRSMLVICFPSTLQIWIYEVTGSAVLTPGERKNQYPCPTPSWPGEAQRYIREAHPVYHARRVYDWV